MDSPLVKGVCYKRCAPLTKNKSEKKSKQQGLYSKERNKDGPPRHPKQRDVPGLKCECGSHEAQPAGWEQEVGISNYFLTLTEFTVKCWRKMMLYGTITNPKRTTKKTTKELSLCFPLLPWEWCALSARQPQEQRTQTSTHSEECYVEVREGGVSLGELNTETKSQNGRVTFWRTGVKTWKC